MAWNGSAKDAKAVVPSKASSTKAHILSTGIVVMAMLVAAIVIMARRTNAKRIDSDITSSENLIHEVAPVTNAHRLVSGSMTARSLSAATNVEAKVDLGYYTNKLGQVKKRTGKTIELRGIQTKQIFKNKCDRLLNAFATTVPGEMCILDIPEDINQQFAESLLSKIEYSEDDTDYERQQKDLVNELKKELASRIKKGEDLKAILQEERRILKKQYEIYNDYNEQIRDLRKAGASEQEIAEFAYAATIKLKENNVLKPIFIRPQERKAFNKIKEEFNHE